MQSLCVEAILSTSLVDRCVASAFDFEWNRVDFRTELNSSCQKSMFQTSCTGRVLGRIFTKFMRALGFIYLIRVYFCGVPPPKKPSDEFSSIIETPFLGGLWHVSGEICHTLDAVTGELFSKRSYRPLNEYDVLSSKLLILWGRLWHVRAAQSGPQWHRGSAPPW